MSTLLGRYNSLPRVARWAILAGAGFAAYFLIVEPVLDQRGAFQVKADEKAKQLASSHSGSNEAEVANSELRTGVTRFGVPELPGAPAERSQAFTKRLASVLQSHGVRDHTSTVKEMPLASSTLASTFGTDYRVDRLVTELQFDASPETFMGVLADLERAPEVAAVSRVQLRKFAPAANSRSSPPRIVKVSLSVEAWQLVRKGRSR